MVEVWERHMHVEFVEHSADAPLTTMRVTPYLNDVPVMTGGVGRDEIRAFTPSGSCHPDVEIELISRTVG
jgi:carboxymethylenebutenolidase